MSPALIQPFTAGEQLYDVEAVRAHRDAMIKLRNEALDQGEMTWAVILSHNVAILAHVILLMNDEPDTQVRGGKNGPQ